MKRKHTNIKQDKEAKSSQILFHKSKKLSQKFNSETVDALEEDQKPAWIDEDDQHAKSDTTTGSKKNDSYTEKLKQKYETLVGAPGWAKINKAKTEDEESEILRSVGHLKKKKTFGLKPNVLDIRILPKLNSQTWNEGKQISCIEFHPKLSVALVGGDSGVVSLLSVGGETNNKLHSFALKGWKISSAAFTPDGTQAFISSQSTKRHFCVYDLVKAQPQMIDFPSFMLKKPNIFELSSNGKYIATSDGFDELFILSATSKELIKRMKQNSRVVSVCFSHNCEQLYCYGAQGEVTIWDLSTFRISRKFYDEGCVKASTLSTSSCGRLLATGSGEGIVNIYETSALKESSGYNPVPYKTISNLTTKITKIKFNASTEIMAAVSNVTPNAVKLVHIPSYNVFANFPIQGPFIGHLNTVGFSPNSGYMAIGNDLQCAYLYRLKYYKNY